MPEILTESFCERCGTRYTFESAAPASKRLGKVKTLSRGFRNFVMSDDSSLDEAMAAARNDVEREATSQQLDAFHRAFNFCMSCRQYTCGNCWNEAEGQCLTCSPHLGQEILPAPFSNLETAPIMDAATSMDDLAWPTSDLRDDVPADYPIDIAPAAIVAGAAATNGFDTLPVPEDEPIDLVARLTRVAPVKDVGIEGAGITEPVVAEAGTVEANVAFEAIEAEVVAETAGADVVAAEAAEPETVAPEPAAPVPPIPDDRVAAATAQTSDLLGRFRPGQSLDAEIAAYEAAAGIEPEVETPSQPGTPRDTDRLAANAATAAAIRAAAAADRAGVVPATPATPPRPIEASAPEPVEPVAAEVPPVRPEPEPVVAAKPVEQPPVEMEPIVVPPAAAITTPEPVVVEPEAPVLEPLAAQATAPQVGEPEPVAASAPEAPWPAEPTRVDVVPQPTWQIVAPDSAAAVGPNGHPLAGVPEATPAPPAVEPQWPAQPEWPAPAKDLSFLATRQTTSSRLTDGLWAASSAELTAAPVRGAAPVGGIQPCTSCGLSLSANARFCRRCGTRQG
jgi:hypothetical protein